MKKSIVTLTLFLYTIFFGMGTAFAAGYLFISPQNLNLNDGKKITQLNLVNKSKAPKTYKVSLKDYYMNEKGNLIAKDLPHSAKKAIQFSPRRITLNPNESQYVNVSVEFNKLDPDQEYHTHIQFNEVKDKKVTESKTSKADKLSFSVGSSYGISIPVFVTKGKATVKVTLDDFTFQKDNENSGTALLSLSRTGKKTGYVKAFFEHISPDGKTTPLGVPSKLKIYREADRVTHSITLEKPDGVSFSQGTISLKLLDSHDDKNAKTIGTKKVTL